MLPPLSLSLNPPSLSLSHFLSLAPPSISLTLFLFFSCLLSLFFFSLSLPPLSLSISLSLFFLSLSLPPLSLYFSISVSLTLSLAHTHILCISFQLSLSLTHSLTFYSNSPSFLVVSDHVNH
jgi:hypothetical protein